MIFVGDVCCALGKSLAEVLALSAAEFAFWVQYARKRGLPAARIEGAAAVSGAYLGNLWGGRREPSDLLPKFGPAGTDFKLLAAQLAALPGAKVRRIPRPERKAAREAEAKAKAREESARAPSRTLNPTPKPKR